MRLLPKKRLLAVLIPALCAGALYSEPSSQANQQAADATLHQWLASHPRFHRIEHGYLSEISNADLNHDGQPDLAACVQDQSPGADPLGHDSVILIFNGPLDSKKAPVPYMSKRSNLDGYRFALDSDGVLTLKAVDSQNGALSSQEFRFAPQGKSYRMEEAFK